MHASIAPSHSGVSVYVHSLYSMAQSAHEKVENVYEINYSKPLPNLVLGKR